MTPNANRGRKPLVIALSVLAVVVVGVAAALTQALADGADKLGALRPLELLAVSLHRVGDVGEVRFGKVAVGPVEDHEAALKRRRLRNNGGASLCFAASLERWILVLPDIDARVPFAVDTVIRLDFGTGTDGNRSARSQ